MKKMKKKSQQLKKDLLLLSPTLHTSVSPHHPLIVVFLMAQEILISIGPPSQLCRSANGPLRFDIRWENQPRQMRSIILRPARPLLFSFELGGCSLKRDKPALSYRRGEQQLPQFRGGSEAVMLVFCFGFFVIVSG